MLSVPVTALLATAGGGYAVQESAAPHRLIPVTPGSVRRRVRPDLGGGHLPGPAGDRLPGMSGGLRRAAARRGDQGIPRRRARAARGQRRDLARRAGRGRRPVGVGQDDDADDPRHARAAEQRRGRGRRPRRRQGIRRRARGAARTPDRVRVPGLPPPGVDDRARQRRQRDALHRRPGAERREAAARGARARRASATGWATGRRSCRVASASGWRSRGRSPSGR